MAPSEGLYENWLVGDDGTWRIWLTGLIFFSWRGPICRCVVASEWNVEGGRLYVAGFLSFLFFLVIEGMLD